MKFTLRDDINTIYIIGTLSDVDFTETDKAKLETTVSTGYTEKTLAEEWDDLKWLLDSDYKKFRNQLINTFADATVWDTLTDNSKKALVRNHVWKSGETQANLNLLYTQQERGGFRKNVMEILDKSRRINICRSTTANSKKHFDVQVNDSGVSTVVEVTTHQTL